MKRKIFTIKTKDNMNNSKHIEEVTSDKIQEWRKKDAFTAFASCTGENGHYEIGVEGTGLYAVRRRCGLNTTTEYYKNSKDAVERYSQVIGS